MSDFKNIASAPGDLMPEAVASRYLALRTQFRHDSTIDPLSPSADESVTVTATSGSGIRIREATVFYTVDGSRPNASSDRVSMSRGAKPGFAAFGGPILTWSATLPGAPAGARVRYRIRATTIEGEEIYAQDGQGFWFRYPVEQSVSTFAYRVGADPKGPEWLRSAVIYQVFVDRFHPGATDFKNGNDLQARHGGSISGIKDALPYLHDLGITCIWVSPIGPAPSYHNYDATDYFSVDPGYGSVEDIRALADAAHDRGIRLILDFVPSHFSRDHEAFQDAITDADSPYRDWFIFYDWPKKYRSFLEVVPHLVSLNTDSDGVREYLIRSARFWLDAGFDGFRLDHVIGHGSDFWAEFQEALEETRPDVVTIGEATDTTDALRRYAGKMNAILDFPIAQVLRRTFGTRDWDVAELEGFLANYEEYMADGPGRVSFADNHDMDRFLHLSGGDTQWLRMALLCLFSLSAAPTLYYGTEIGMGHEEPTSNRAAGGDALCRQDMPWDESMWDTELHAFVRDLITLRHERSASITSGSRETILVERESGVLGYRLGESMQVWFNTSEREKTVRADISSVLLSTGSQPDLDNGTVTIPPQSGFAAE